jgi:hypothetical protein
LSILSLKIMEGGEPVKVDISKFSSTLLRS